MMNEELQAAEARLKAHREDPSMHAMQAYNRFLDFSGRMAEQFAKLGKTPDDMEEFNRKLEELRNLAFGTKSEPKVEVRRPRVYIAVPRTGGVEWNTAVQVLAHASDGERYDHDAHSRGSSLLACTFNMLVIHCLNQRGAWDWWCMVHSDLWPYMYNSDAEEKPLYDKKGWLEVLVDEAIAKNASVMHAISPIKTLQAMSSTSVGDSSRGVKCPTCDNYHRPTEWEPRRRICIKELPKLPETFCLADVLACLEGKFPDNPVLLPNTGCLLIRIDVLERFARDGGFEVRDRILPPPETDADWSQKCIPEDWNFGYWCANNGVEVWGTQKVKIDHVGSFTYPSHGDWGGCMWDHDKAYKMGQD